MSRSTRAILLLLCVCSFGHAADPFSSPRPRMSHRFGARVGYPSISVACLGTAGYWTKSIFYAAANRYSAREALLVVPFGGLYQLSSATNLGVGIAQTVKLKRSGLNTHGATLAMQTGLSVLTFASYGVTLGCGAADLFSVNSSSPLAEMLFVTSGMMTANLVFTIAAFRWRTDTLLEPTVEPRRVMVAPVIGVSRQAPVLGLQAHLTL